VTGSIVIKGGIALGCHGAAASISAKLNALM
jgi:hypothetical protein